MDRSGSAKSSAPLRDATRSLIEEGRYCFVLLEEAAENIREVEATPAWRSLTEEMAMVPAGPAPIVHADGIVEMVEIPAFYLDRCTVTNRAFQRFVAAGGYDQFELWPEVVWPSLMRFVDKGGQAGPASWTAGAFPQGKADHPVVGICWYEALAYARWVGKRLPTAAEWQKAAGWPEPLGGMTRRYPWGDVFDPTRANLWASGLGDTCSVTSCHGGDTPNGIHQLTGNVWEWLDDPLETVVCQSEETFEPWRPMRRIHGGAFDTYLQSEATTHFITGQAELDRRHNLGFRCAVSADRLRPRHVS